MSPFANHVNYREFQKACNRKSSNNSDIIKSPSHPPLPVKVLPRQQPQVATNLSTYSKLLPKLVADKARGIKVLAAELVLEVREEKASQTSNSFATTLISSSSVS